MTNVSAKVYKQQQCDEEILQRIANNDPLAFKVFYNVYCQVVQRFISYFDVSGDLRQDIISDIFLSIWVGRKRLPEIVNMDSFLFIVVRNQVIKYKRDKIAQLQVSLDSYDFLPDKSASNAQQQMEQEELKKTIEMAINSLPKRCKMIYLLVKEENMKYSEVAEMLSISKKTVQAQMIIAVKKIGQAIKNIY